MKATIVVFAVVLIGAFASSGVSAMPAEEVSPVNDFLAEAQDLVLALKDQPEEDVAAPAPSRQKRATCDLFSGLGLNHSACAAHCIAKRYRGGYCNGKGVCVCRN